MYLPGEFRFFFSILSIYQYIFIDLINFQYTIIIITYDKKIKKYKFGYLFYQRKVILV